ncbi:hypothetical protein PUNSTDRAFT_135606 [Punctularia strigosozonata HHB-11173 SS5]|uniref:uncharacterized protein n=1 Tax=Punctularia strigosozonata (strain HHB-11173) TaxID=741275 RepID=UPI000441768E|nr:uncharacterized protein PUNSTDRAFT_135606 [Punctularia strigosozonata HHB-11173 SS5]EIN08092.1 hypothetical protein PUNSTDRAFT_135606 [Punctularia strigosozonata HHB-11173 SS5]
MRLEDNVLRRTFVYLASDAYLSDASTLLGIPAVALVCKHWLEIAKSVPSLWMIAVQNWEPQRFLRLLEPPLPLCSIGGIGPRSTTERPVRLDWYIGPHAVFDILSDQDLTLHVKTRIQNITEMHLAVGLEFLDELIKGVPEMPKLKVLRIDEQARATDLDSPRWHSLRVTSLENLCLQHARIPPITSFLNGARLFHLVIRFPPEQRYQMKDFLHLLTLLPKLETLTWEASLPQDQDESLLNRIPMADLYRLRRLRLAGNTASCTRILQRVRTPGPVQISISAEHPTGVHACSSVIDAAKTFYGHRFSDETELAIAVSEDFFAIGVGKPRSKSHPETMKWRYEFYVAFHALKKPASGQELADRLVPEFRPHAYKSLVINASDIHHAAITPWYAMIARDGGMDQIDSLTLIGTTAVLSMLGAVRHHRNAGSSVLPKLATLNVLVTLPTPDPFWLKNYDEEACFCRGSDTPLRSIRFGRYCFDDNGPEINLPFELHLRREIFQLFTLSGVTDVDVADEAQRHISRRNGRLDAYISLTGAMELNDRPWPWRKGATWDGLHMEPMTESRAHNLLDQVFCPEIDFLAPPAEADAAV